MKLHLSILASGCLLIAASSANAQSALNMNGTISATCTVLSLSKNTVDFGDISDPAGPGVLNAAAINGSLTATTPSITCNGGGTTLSIDAEPLLGPTLPAGAPSSFSRTINYTATISKAGASDFIQILPAAGVANATTASAATNATVGLIAGNFSIALSNAAATGVLIAGGYSGTLTIALTPG
jgi:hypothetical protein